MLVRVLAISVFLMFQGCSGKDSDGNAAAAGGEPQHVWKEQVKALDKAGQLEQDMSEAFRRRMEETDTQSH